jgi:two-component system, OmpR family, response regulator
VRVLVVEDEATLAGQLSAALHEAGYAVDSAADGAQAEFMGQTEPYDAVILDLGLPGMGGLTVLRRWREAGMTVPVLILTARDSWHEKVQGIDGGARDFHRRADRADRRGGTRGVAAIASRQPARSGLGAAAGINMVGG